MITTQILADSINPSGHRITSFLCTYPRFIHSEVMTHRVFSRNAASSRAIPFRKMYEAIAQNPACPERWPGEQKGMQGGESIDATQIETCAFEWRVARQGPLIHAAELNGNGVHKSLCNRLLEPWAHITTLITATDFTNFFALRAHPAAMPEFQVLAYRMLHLYINSIPTCQEWGTWHLPRFEGAEYPLVHGLQNGLKIATARCARLSFLTFDGEYSVEKDCELHDRLVESGHWSPFEHCAQAKRSPSHTSDYSNFDINFQWRGWLQYRKAFLTSEENLIHENLHKIMDSKPLWITL